jgi:hypothetical protein
MIRLGNKKEGKRVAGFEPDPDGFYHLTCLRNRGHVRIRHNSARILSRDRFTHSPQKGSNDIADIAAQN